MTAPEQPTPDLADQIAWQRLEVQRREMTRIRGVADADTAMSKTIFATLEAAQRDAEGVERAGAITEAALVLSRAAVPLSQSNNQATGFWRVPTSTLDGLRGALSAEAAPTPPPGDAAPNDGNQRATDLLLEAADFFAATLAEADPRAWQTLMIYAPKPAPPGDAVSFMRESNRIEGIHREPTAAEIEATNTFLALPVLTAPDVEALVSVYQPDAVLRDRHGLNVRVGNYTAPLGNPQIRKRLETILFAISTDARDPWKIHVLYEALHPFTDGNGRSGRAIWLWQMTKLFGGAPLGFLHHFYYQTLEKDRAS